MGKSKEPNKCSGFNQPVSGPRMIPAMSKNTIAGSFTHHANHWQKIATMPMTERAITASWCIGFPWSFMR